jgi:hypothetical protein
MTYAGQITQLIMSYGFCSLRWMLLINTKQLQNPTRINITLELLKFKVNTRVTDSAVFATSSLREKWLLF